MNFLHVVFLYLFFQLLFPLLLQALLGFSSNVYSFPSLSSGDIVEMYIVSFCLIVIFVSSLYLTPLRIPYFSRGPHAATVINIFGLRCIHFLSSSLLFASVLALAAGANSFRYTTSSLSEFLVNQSPLFLIVPTLNILTSFILLVITLYESSASNRRKYLWSIYMLCLAGVYGLG
jgi:hypothetical protein